MSDIFVPLRNRPDHFALVDEVDAEALRLKWYATDKPKTTYAGGAKGRSLHRFVAARMGILSAEFPEVDHGNRIGLDCRRNNLRAATRSQNVQNQSVKSNNSTGFKGVSWITRDRLFVAQGQIPGGKRKAIGYFKRAEDAAHAYDAFAREHYGAFACLNFPDTDHGS